MKKAMFFDLQGTLGGEFLGDVRDFEFFPNGIKALKKAKAHGYLIFIITNQSRIAKGFLTMEDYQKHEQRILEEMKSADVLIDGFYCCPHGKDECTCKKPQVGMIEKAMTEYDIDIKNSFVIGDLGMSDMILAKNIGSKSVLVLTGGGQSSLSEFRHTWKNVEPTYIEKDVLSGVNKIIHQRSCEG